MDALEFLHGAIAIPSVSGEERAVAEYLTQHMQDLGFEQVHIDGAGNARGQRGCGPLQVVLLGHIDTVAGVVPVRIEDGKLYGRGSVDAKGPFCTFVRAVSQLSPEALAKATFYVVGATEEEAPTSKGARYVTDKLKPDYVVIGEPSDWSAITLGYKGRLLAKITLEKDLFHSAHFESNAAEDLFTFFQNFKTFADHENHNATPFALLQYELRDFKMGQQDTKVWAEMSIGLRLPPQWQPEVAKQTLGGMLHAYIPQASVQYFGVEVPYVGAKDSPLTRALRVAIRSQGGEPKLKYKTGTADMNVVAPHWNVPMVAYGAGDSQLDHTPTEHVVIEDYLKSIEVLHTALERLVQ